MGAAGEHYRRAVATGCTVSFEQFYPDPIGRWFQCHCYPSRAPGSRSTISTSTYDTKSTCAVNNCSALSKQHGMLTDDHLVELGIARTLYELSPDYKQQAERPLRNQCGRAGSPTAAS